MTRQFQSAQWFHYETETAEHGFLGALLKTLIGAVLGTGVFFWISSTLGIVIWTITAIIGVVTLASQKGRSTIGRFFAALGQAIGGAIGVVLLVPVFLIGFTIAHCVSRLTGRDPLHLKNKDAQTFWLPADKDRRKTQYIRALFATEANSAKRSRGWVGLLAIAGALLVAAEILLRILGFGAPILYRQDVRAGYYPGPNQSVYRGGGNISTNNYGMRAPEFEPEKESGVMRIFMIGDSTLWGGSYLDQPEIYARRICDSLTSQYGEEKVEVLNIGVNAWGPFNKLGYVQKFGTFDADVAVICLPIGDIYRDLAKLKGLPYFTVEDPPRLALDEVLQHMIWRRQASRKRPTPEQREEQSLEGIAAYVNLARRLREAGCDVLVEILPGRVAGTTAKIPAEEQQDVERLTKALVEADFQVGYPAGLFKGMGDLDDLYHDVCHLNGLGNQLYAEYLEQRIKEKCQAFQFWEKSSLVAAEERDEP